MSPTIETNDTPVSRIPRALIVVEGGVVSGTYEDPGVEVRVYRFQWSPETDKADAAHRVLVTVSGGVADMAYTVGEVDPFLLDVDDQAARGEPIVIPERFADLVARADLDAECVTLSRAF